MSLAPVLAQIDADLDESIARLFHLLRIRSISTDPVYKEECEKAANWLVNQLTLLGADAKKCDTPGHPMVVGRGFSSKRGRKTSCTFLWAL